MNEKITVFTESDQLYDTVKKCVLAENIEVSKFNIKEYKKAGDVEADMLIVDFDGYGDTHEDLMKIFNVKYYINKSILVCIGEIHRRYLLDLFSFGVEDYIKKPLDENEMTTKIAAILRYQRWLDKNKFRFST